MMKQNFIQLSKRFWKISSNNIFSMIGILFLGLVFIFLVMQQVQTALASLGAAAACLIFHNIKHFKSFKIFGVQAELLEKKQEEADVLLQKLRDLFLIYSNEILFLKATHMRFGHQNRWKEIWPLFDKIKAEHKAIKVPEELDKIKNTLDNYFLIDLIVPKYREVVEELNKCKRKSEKIISEKFGNPVKDIEDYEKCVTKLKSIKIDLDDAPMHFVQKQAFSETIIELLENARQQFQKYFDCQPNVKEGSMQDLQKLARIERDRPIKNPEQLLELFEIDT